ncbi:serine/threonine-protein kinase [Calothrix sp. PCC 7507]|uniref:serine/threonine-protein kinase n=1 Tax=Calothrix sp. PCC 7507 TaxID=99598 RepID=UPI00029F1246|nr:serine/threonine-protein kinase [Calothrix sp. PCC 7507]AFY35499.1 serine/threonine protein kinase with TPR repeats [Calothrix sp. PCC 7507]
MNSQLLDARYRILTVLSAGEVAQTYLVEDTRLPSSPYILKQLHPASNNPQALKILRRLFASEAATLEKLGQEHDQIQKLVAYFEENEEFYLVQEFIPGLPLTEEILLGTPLTEDQVINLLTEILEILVFVHSNQVIHQDIKPANIIRRKSDDKLVLIDFGAVKEIVTTIVGNLEYIPVEQLHGNFQYNSDIYALGIVGIAAIMGLTANEIAILPSQKNLLTGEIVWRNRHSQVNKNLAKIIDKMVRFDFRKRYQSAIEVLHDLQQLNNPEHQQKNLKSKKIKLILTGIAGCIAVSIAAWFFLTPKPVGNAKEIYQRGVGKYEIGNYSGAVKDLTQAIELNPKNALAYNRRGDAFYRLGEYQKAQADSSKAIQLNPRDANAYYDRGFTFYELGKYPAAIADYTKAITLNSRNAYAYYGRGIARVQMKDHQGAFGDFSKAIALKSNYTEAYLQRGIIRRRLKQKQAAIQDLDAAIELNPNDAKAYYQRGLAQFSNQQKHAAVSDFTNAINLSPKYIEAYLSRGDAHSELGNKLEATADYNKVLQINPKSSIAYVRRGAHRFSFGDVQGAIKDYTQAIKLDSKNAAAYNNRGNVHLERGNQKAASEDYSQAIKVNPSYALAYYNRGLIKAKQGNRASAIGDFQQAAKLFEKKGNKEGYQDAQSQIKLLQPQLK